MIYYVSLDNPHPSGGVKTQYRHVEILNDAGYPAAMLHQNPGFTSATWFRSTAPIRYANQVEVGPGDVLVWPEILRSSILPNNAGGPKQVIFNQNIHYTWRGSLDGAPPTSYPDVLGTMVLTEYEHDFLRVVVPSHRIGVVRHGIDPRTFNYSGQAKEKCIAYMPRKHRDEAEAVFGWLSSIGALVGWRVVAIDGQSEEESASTLQRSAFFFAFGYPEGGTLPPFEALACGAEVIGYGGFASDALLLEAGGQRVASGDTCKFAAIASHVLRKYSFVPEISIEKSRKCLALFPMEGERNQLLQFMRETGCIDA